MQNFEKENEKGGKRKRNEKENETGAKIPNSLECKTSESALGDLSVLITNFFSLFR